MNITKAFSTTNTTLLKNRKIEYIGIHYTAGTTSKAGTAANLAVWFKNGANPKNPSSSDFIVDDTAIVQYNGDIENRYTWGVGGSKYANPSTPLGARLYGKAKNANTINIEVCSNKRNIKSLDANDTDWYFTNSELDLLAELVKYLMDKYNIDADHVIMHHEVTGKLCPAMWTHNESELKNWYDFKARLSSTSDAAAKKEMYYVQVGAFSVKENAEKYLEKVKKDYPNAFIKVM